MAASRTLKIALIEPGSPGLHIYSHVAMGRGIPILATVVARAGHDVRAYVEDISGKGSVDWEWVQDCDVVGFSAITCTLPRTAELAGEARRRNPGAVIVFGGPEPTCAPERSFDAGADFVIRGEGELSLPRFLDALAAEKDGGSLRAVRTVPGIVWREASGVRFGPPRRQLSRDQVMALPQIDTTLVKGFEESTTVPVWRARGCPERCDFCEVHEIWPRYVLRDETASVDELMDRQETSRGGAFLIDDNCAANKPSFKRFLREAIERGYHKPIAVQLRADAIFNRDGTLDRELLRLLRSVAPVTMLCVGVESASDEDLAETSKHQESERVAKALRAMRRWGLLVHGMMIAFADDTTETLHRNGVYARKYVTSLQYLFEVPLPGTRRTAQHAEARRILWHELTDLKYLDGMHIALEPGRTTPRDMQDTVIREYRRFYSRTRIALSFLQGLFVRHFRLSSGQRRYLRKLHVTRRFREWVWMHLQFKFAPWAMLRIGRQRVLAFLDDAEYQSYLQRLEG